MDLKLHQEETCSPQDHLGVQQPPLPTDDHIDKAARIFRALGDTARLRLVARLAAQPACVSELALAENESITTISQRLRVLRADNIVHRRKQGKHTLYSLADSHMRALALNALAHAAHPLHNEPIATPDKEKRIMATTHTVHENHIHQHGPDCGHTAIQHDDHVDYLHDGHLHFVHDGHIDEHVLEVSSANPAECTDGHDCSGHDATHRHGTGCGHEPVPHGDHTDYLVAGHLHNPDGSHCDDHGPVTILS